MGFGYLQALVTATGVNLKMRQIASTEASLEVLRAQLSEQATNLSEAHNEALSQKKRGDELAIKAGSAEKRAAEAEKKVAEVEHEAKELKEKLDAMSSELQAQRSLSESLEAKIHKLKTEKEEAEDRAEEAGKKAGAFKAEIDRAKEVEKQVGALKAGKLEAESKLLEAEMAHASCKTQIADLLGSVAKKERVLKEWEDAWKIDRKKMSDDIADAFNAGVDQMKAYLQERHQALGVDWGAISLDDILSVGEGMANEGGEEEAPGEGSGGVGEAEGGKNGGSETERGGVETKLGGVVIKGIE